jgi:hypothetical protein
VYVSLLVTTFAPLNLTPFFVKDLQSIREMLCCASDGDLYTFPATTDTHAHLIVPSVVWH